MERSNGTRPRLALIAGLVGVGFAGVASIGSYLWAVGGLPPTFFGKGAWLATLRQIHDAPIELGLLAGFVLVVATCRADLPPTLKTTAILWLSTILLGFSAGLIWSTPRALPLWGTAFAGLLALLSLRGDALPGGFAIARLPSATLALLRVGPVRNALVLCLLSTLVVGLAMGSRASHVSRNDAVRRDLFRWYRAAVPLDVPGLRASSKSSRRLVVFTDYQCPACRVVVPQYRAVVASARLQGLDLEFITRDYPIEPECNSAATAPLHSMACEMAVASRLVKRSLPDQHSAFENWLYQQTGEFTREELKVRLRQMGLDTNFEEEYESLLLDVQKDADFATSVGVYSTPVVFLDGVRLPSITPMGLQDLLNLPFQTRATSDYRSPE